MNIIGCTRTNDFDGSEGRADGRKVSRSSEAAKDTTSPRSASALIRAIRIPFSLNGILNRPRRTETADPSRPSPFSMLPAELLQEILNNVIILEEHPSSPHGHRYFPYTALAVSRTWRQIATSTPELWSTIHFRGDTNPKRLSKRFRHHVECSKLLPLRLIIHVRSGVVKKWIKNFHKGLVGIGNNVKGIHILINTDTPNVSDDVYSLGAESLLNSALPNGPHPFPNLQELEIGGTADASCTQSSSYFLVLGRSLPELQKLIITIPGWYPEHEFGGPPQEFPKLRTLILYFRHMDQVACWLRRATLPVLEELLVSCDQDLPLHKAYCAKYGVIKELPAVRRAALYRVGEHTSRLILGGLPNVEKLVVTCEANGRIPAWLDNPFKCPKLSELILWNPSLHRLDRVREKIEKRRRSLRTITLDADFAAGSNSRGFTDWLQGRGVDVRVWPVSHLAVSTVLERMSC